jgi:hypothetical protein
MGIFDKLRRQATKAVDEHGDQIAKGLDKAGDLVDEQTKGKHSRQVDKGVAGAKDALDKLDGRDDDIPKRKPPGQS